jgi:predicted deacetylase
LEKAGSSKLNRIFQAAGESASPKTARESILNRKDYTEPTLRAGFRQLGHVGQFDRTAVAGRWLIDPGGWSLLQANTATHAISLQQTAGIASGARAQ